MSATISNACKRLANLVSLSVNFPARYQMRYTTKWRRKLRRVNKQIISIISLCKRAGKLIMGFDAVKEAAEKSQISIILTANDISPKSCKEIVRVAQINNVAILSIPVSMDEIFYNVGKRAGILAVSDSGLAKKLIGTLELYDNKEE